MGVELGDVKFEKCALKRDLRSLKNNFRKHESQSSGTHSERGGFERCVGHEERRTPEQRVAPVSKSQHLEGRGMRLVWNVTETVQRSISTRTDDDDFVKMPKSILQDDSQVKNYSEIELT